MPSGYGATYTATYPGPGVGVAASWAGSYAPPLSLPAGTIPAPANEGLGIPVAIPAGDWAVAVVSWRQPPGYPPVTIASVADDVHSWWEPLGAPQASSSPQGVTRTVAWFCPRNRGASLVQASPTGFVLSLVMRVFDVTGMSDWILQVLPALQYANAATALNMSVPAPGSLCFLFTGAASDLLGTMITGPGAGWTAMPAVTASNGSDNTSDLQLNTGWQASAGTGSVSANWTAGGAVDFSGLLGGLIATPPPLTQPNPDWPIVIAEAAVGAGFGTPADQMQWTPLAAPMLDLAFTQGRQYERNDLATGDGVLTADNPYGLLLPPSFPQSAGIDSGTPVRVRCYWPGGTGGNDPRGPANPTPWYVPFNGYIERLPQAWDECRRGFTGATITDLWAGLTGNMQPILPAEILADMAAGRGGGYWPCTDLPGSEVASNLAGGDPLWVRISKYGSAGASQAFGQNTSAIPGAAGTFLINPQYRVSSQAGMWGVQLTGSLPLQNIGWSLTGASQSFPRIDAGVTIEFWFQNLAPFFYSAVGRNMVMNVVSANGAGFGILLDIAVASGGTGNLLLDTTGTNNGGTVATISNVNYQQAGAPLTHVALAFNRTSWTSYVDGVKTNTGTWATQLPPAFAYVSFAGLAGTPAEALRYNFWNYMSGSFGHIAVFPGILHPARILTHYLAGSAGVEGEPASQRIERILSVSGNANLRRLIQYPTAMAAGGGLDAVVSCQDLPGSPAGQAIVNISNSTPPGTTVITPGGELFTLAKQYAFGQPARWVLGENTAAGEAPYQSDVALGYDPQRVVNDVQLTHLDRQDIITSQVPAITQASAGQYRPGTINNTGYLDGDAYKPLNFGPGLYDLANWLACTYRAPQMRGETVTIDAATYPAAWPVVLGAACADMALLNRRPITMAGTISIPGRISQTQRRLVFGYGGTVTGSLQLIVDAAPEQQALTCDDPVLGQLNGKNLLGG